MTLTGHHPGMTERLDDGWTAPPSIVDRVGVDGRRLTVGGGHRFTFTGVSYGTFAPRPVDGHPVPDRSQLVTDFAQMARAGVTVARVYTAAPDDLLDIAGESGVRVMAGLHHGDWRDHVQGSRRDRARVERDAERVVRAEARRRAGDPRIVAACLANEIPADVVRWVGADHVRAHLRRLAEAVREEDPGALITYANYPTTEYLTPDLLDIVTFNVFLDRSSDLRRYVSRLMVHAGDRPVILGEIGRHTEGDAADEDTQARWLDAQLRVATEAGVAGTCVFSWTDDWHVGGVRVDGWRFGLTRSDRSPRPALEVVSRWSSRSIRDVRTEWPRISVVVCAYDEEQTIGECLHHTVSLDYPSLEVIVVDDGSTDRTQAIAESFARSTAPHVVTVLSAEHGGLSAARNVGWQHATGEIVAFLDADAYPSADWPYHLALGFEGNRVGAVGGPNVGPPTDPTMARCVAAAPGGPNHVLVDDHLAEHVPGCNLAVRKSVLVELGGFDPLFRTAGDDVDVCWRMLERHHQIRFVPAALVWHHRRGSVRAYLRQQRGYGRAETLVEARHPDRCSVGGGVRWHGRIYSPLPRLFTSRRVYRGPLGTASFQSVYAGGAGWDDVAHQLGVPAAAATIVGSAVVGLAWQPAAWWLAAAAVTFCTALVVIDARRAKRTRSVPADRWSALTVGLLGLVQPLARWWGRHERRAPIVTARRDTMDPLTVVSTKGGTVAVVEDRPRAEVAAAIIDALRRRRLRVHGVTGWEDHDGAIATSALRSARVLTSGHPAGIVQARITVRMRWRNVGLVAVGCAVAWWLSTWWVGAATVCVVASTALLADGARGARRVSRARQCLVNGLT